MFSGRYLLQPLHPPRKPVRVTVGANDKAADTL